MFLGLPCQQIELITVSRRIKDNVKEMERIDQALEGNTAYGQEIDLNVQKLAQILRTTEQRLNRMVSRTVVQEFQDELGVGQEFHPPGVSKLLTSKKESLASTVRMVGCRHEAIDCFMTRLLYSSSMLIVSKQLKSLLVAPFLFFSQTRFAKTPTIEEAWKKSSGLRWISW